MGTIFGYKSKLMERFKMEPRNQNIETKYRSTRHFGRKLLMKISNLNWTNITNSRHYEAGSNYRKKSKQ